MTGEIRRFSDALALLSRGDVTQKLDEELNNCLNALEEMPSDKGKATINLTLTFNYELGRVDVKADVKSKLPDTTKFVPTPFWVDDGQLYSQHPQQIDIFQPRKVTDNDSPSDNVGEA